jgi:hypothetical protein
MASMEELSANLQGALILDDPNGLLALALAATEQAQHDQDIITVTTQGSKSSEAIALNGHMHQIAAILGELMVEIGGALNAKDTLLARWSVVSSPEVYIKPPIERAPITADFIRLQEYGTQRALDSALPDRLRFISRQKRELLAARGVHTLRDALVAGTIYLHGTQHFRESSIDSIRAYAAEVLPGAILHDTPTPTDIAAFCPDLTKVSWAALHYEGLSAADTAQLGLGQRQLSVQDLLTLPQDDIIGAHANAATISKYNILVHQAHKFAQEFEAAKTEQAQQRHQ